MDPDPVVDHMLIHAELIGHVGLLVLQGNYEVRASVLQVTVSLRLIIVHA